MFDYILPTYFVILFSQCFPGIRVTENRDLVNPDTIVIHVGTKDLRRTGNLDYVMEDVYDLVNTTKTRERESSPITDLEWPRGFQEVKVPRFHDNGTRIW